MTTKSDLIAARLVELEAALCRAGLWASTAPSARALNSALPFCVDTLRLEQWLQFVFMPKIQIMIDQKKSLPTTCAIAPVAEQAFVGDPNALAGIVHILHAIDQTLTETH